MSYADKLFIDMCSDIIENGYSTEGEKVRPKWPDGTYAYTIKKFGVVNRYDLSKEFPAITLRKTYIRSAIDEILWIWQKKSNNVHDLSSHIWDEGRMKMALLERHMVISLERSINIKRERWIRLTEFYLI